MKRIKIYMAVCLVLISFFPLGCLQEPEKPSSMATPAVSVRTPISVTAPAGTPFGTVRTPSRYIVLIDDYSFYKVTDTTLKEIDYKNFTLNINTGDTVEWRNEANYNDILTLISDQDLWAPGDLRTKLINKPFNYTFAKPGNYTFRIKEEPRMLPQTIIVKP